MATQKSTAKDETSTTEPEPVDLQQVVDAADFDRLVHEVLGGRYGDHASARKKLTDEGHDPVAVLAAVNRRIAGGAPHAYELSAVGLLRQVQDGEWGAKRGLSQRLMSAGFSQPVISEVLSHLDKE